MNEINKQDELLRSLMQEGCEEVPPQLWDKISKRLDTPEVMNTVHRPRWKHLVYGLSSAAAILVSALVLWKNFPSTEEAVSQLTPNTITALALEEGISVLNENTQIASEDNLIAEAFEDKIIIKEKALEKSEAKPLEKKILKNSEEKVSTKKESINTETVTQKAASTESNKSDNNPEEDFDYIEDYGDKPTFERNKVKFALTLASNASGNTAGKEINVVHSHRPSDMKPIEDRVLDHGNPQYSVPLEVGLGLKVQFAKRWSVATGVKYTMMDRKFDGTFMDGKAATKTATRVKNTQHYIGVPLNFYYSIIKKDWIDFYTMFGGAVEKNIGNKYLLYELDNRIWKQKVKGVQWSVDLGIGVEFIATKWLGIYIDPSLHYYFNNSQPSSIRTAQPLSIGAEIGLRFRL